VLTATDFWFLCARNTLLHADGSLCSGPDGEWKCASCLLSGAKAYEWPARFLSGSLTTRVLRLLATVPAITNRSGFRGMLGSWPRRVQFLLDSLGRVDLIVTASAFLKDLFVHYGVDAGRIEHSSYGLDTNWAVGMDAKTPSDELRVGFIGQLVPIKGPDLLIKAVRLLPQEVRLQVRLYGDLSKAPPYGRSLQALAGGDDRITFCGTFPNNRMGEVLRDIDVLVVPSVWYDFPLVIQSAFATRTPVIATNLPGMNELVTDGVNGFLFARGNTVELSRHLGRLAANPAALESMRPRIGPVKDVEHMAAEYVERYERLTRHR
jgi:glycosyltransferase involved in cell wall biosynthesis